MLGILSLLLLLYLMLFISRIITLVLMHTGMSREHAKLQVRSAITGTGFTTHESELMVRHPVRRRILMQLMIFGNVGVVGAISSLLLGFLEEEKGFNNIWGRIGLMACGLVLLWLLANSRIFERAFDRMLNRFLPGHGRKNAYQLQELCVVGDDLAIMEVHLTEESVLCGRLVGDVFAPDGEVQLLGLRRGSEQVKRRLEPDIKLLANDIITVYGPPESIAGEINAQL